jgi:uncharacterized protein (DUF1684 family)
MRTKSLILAACATALAVLAAGCTRPGAADNYAHDLLAARAAKDATFASSGNSPIPPDRRATLLPLKYFPPDPAYRTPAQLVPAATGGTVEIVTSTGQRRSMQVMGTLEFSLKGRPLTLTAFAEEGSSGERLFVPFADLTSGKETYGGGRYVDLEQTATGIYVIDFNTAYNPYCAYNPSYDCPVPPRENRLPVEIRAGERAG